MTTKPRATSNLTELLQVQKRDTFLSLNCMKIGEVVSFDSAKKTVQVKILFKRIKDGAARSYPLLVDVPVFTLQGGGGGFQAAIEAGDQCLVLFSDRNLDAWFSTGVEQVPFDARSHDLTDGIALVGVNALTSDFADYLPGVVRMFLGGADVRCEDGEVTLTGGSAVIGTASGKVLVQNATTDLLAATTALFTALSALKTTSNLTLHADSLALITTARTQFEALLAVAT